jgi:crossover junction endodeoxyribonuclease RuvC
LKKPVLVLAIDPGLSGAVALAGRGALEVRRDFESYHQIATSVAGLLEDHEPEHILVELVGARPGQGVVSMFHFGEATGVGLGALHALRPCREIERVSPLKWKNFYRYAFQVPQGEEVDAREIALELLPQFQGLFKRKKDHNTADAVLLALWKLFHLKP